MSIFRELLMKQLHKTLLHWHRGASALYRFLKLHFWWPGCHKYCIKYSYGYEYFQKNNPSIKKPHRFLQSLPASHAAFRHLKLYFIGPLPICIRKNQKYRFILQVVECYTKCVWIMPMERLTAHNKAGAFLNNVIHFAGLQDSIVSD